MGIKGLMKLIDENAKGSFKIENKNTYNQRTIAFDASTQLYAFMAQIRTSNGISQLLTNKDGEITSHILGFLTRTILLLETGINPIFVFDGKPPDLKYDELSRRKELKSKANNEIDNAKKKLESDIDSEEYEQTISDINKFQKRNLIVSKKHNDDIKKLLHLLGLPIIEAPCEAEAQCAQLCKEGKAWATATEDMDILAFGSPIMLKRMTGKDEVVEIRLDFVLDKLNLNYDSFVDLCILCGCDYSNSISRIGPKTALKLILEHKNIENVIKNLDENKYNIPDTLKYNLNNIRELFKNPVVKNIDTNVLKRNSIKYDELYTFLVNENGFDEERTKKYIERLKIIKNKGTQTRLDSFFKINQSSSFKNTTMKKS